MAKFAFCPQLCFAETFSHPKDQIFVEEAFERLLLDYDRVFSSMGSPACLWRRTGEIYKGNREFTELVGVDGVMLRDVRLFSLSHSSTNPTRMCAQGRLCIYELMAEESAVNYWEVAFFPFQKSPRSLKLTHFFRRNMAMSPLTCLRRRS
jgi:hypothetical protein